LIPAKVVLFGFFFFLVFYFKMYDAYEALPILEKLPLLIESIAAYGMSFVDIW
jgi:hypothetical protein